MKGRHIANTSGELDPFVSGYPPNPHMKLTTGVGRGRA
jgi:hypothetical protein